MAVLNGGYLVQLLFISLLDFVKKGAREMKLLLMILFLPLMLTCNVIGGLSALIKVAVVNGYCYVTELLEKAQEK